MLGVANSFRVLSGKYFKYLEVFLVLAAFCNAGACAAAWRGSQEGRVMLKLADWRRCEDPLQCFGRREPLKPLLSAKQLSLSCKPHFLSRQDVHIVTRDGITWAAILTLTGTLPVHHHGNTQKLEARWILSSDLSLGKRKKKEE